MGDTQKELPIRWPTASRSTLATATFFSFVLAVASRMDHGLDERRARPSPTLSRRGGLFDRPSPILIAAMHRLSRVESNGKPGLAHLNEGLKAQDVVQQQAHCCEMRRWFALQALTDSHVSCRATPQCSTIHNGDAVHPHVAWPSTHEASRNRWKSRAQPITTNRIRQAVHLKALLSAMAAAVHSSACAPPRPCIWWLRALLWRGLRGPLPNAQCLLAGTRAFAAPLAPLVERLKM
ncbi:hypothetical protein G7046_g6401 [Stylonectria norvegica]|nr:hypothetical protein G7046_g6401 [Stylonectria norvegica]